MSIAVVIDVQYGFLAGGNLSVMNDEATASQFTKNIDTFLKTNGITTVYFTKDMHHPINASIGSVAGTETNNGRPVMFQYTPKYYTGKNTKPDSYGSQFPTLNDKLNRTWMDTEVSDNQMIWPVHCILPKSDPWYNILVGRKSNSQEYYSNSLYNKTTATGKDDKNGSDLAWELEKYDSGADAPFDYYTVYKGFGKKIDSYSALADAHGYKTPFIAKHKGAFLTDANPVTYFVDELNAKVASGVTDIYVIGIATNYCVEQSVKDILDFVVLPNKDSHPVKVHFVHNLTLPVPGDANPPSSIADINSRVSEKFSVSLSPLDTYFVVENSAMTGGRRTKVKHTKRNCKCGKTHKKCKCGKASKGHKKTRRCF